MCQSNLLTTVYGGLNNFHVYNKDEFYLKHKHIQKNKSFNDMATSLQETPDSKCCGADGDEVIVETVVKTRFGADDYDEYEYGYAYDDDVYDDDDMLRGAYGDVSAAGSGGASKMRAANAGAAERVLKQSMDAKINFGPMSHSVGNQIAAGEKKAGAARNIGLCRDSRVTWQQCFDFKTVQVLQKFVNAGTVATVYGEIAMGKEAGCYYAASHMSVEELFPLKEDQVTLEELYSAPAVGSAATRGPQASFLEDVYEEDANGESDVEGVVPNSEVALEKHSSALDSSGSLSEATEMSGVESNTNHTDPMNTQEPTAREHRVAEAIRLSQNAKGNTYSNSQQTVHSQRKKAKLVSQEAAEVQKAAATGTKKRKKKEEYPLVLKIYQTSNMQFKDRERYVSGDRRMRGSGGSRKNNPRQVIPAWCEKEYRNLMRIKQTAQYIKSPIPLEYRRNVLLMSFIGSKGGEKAPRLKDVSFPELSKDDAALQWDLLYLQCCLYMRDLFQNCRLVHGDLSEYNLLFWRNELYLIDVSQSVESDHPEKFDMLKQDCVNVNRFFAKKDVDTFTVRRLFNYVISDAEKDIEDLRIEMQLEDDQYNRSTLTRGASGVSLGGSSCGGFEWQRSPSCDSVSSAGDDAAPSAPVREELSLKKRREQDDEVFLQTWIPSNLHQLSDLAELDREADR